MPFITKPDFSNNRQAKQFQFSSTQLSGTTVFGVDDVYIPINQSGFTINVDALQYIQTRGLIFANAVPEFTGSTYQLLGRDNDTGEVVAISGVTGTTTTGTTDHPVTAVTTPIDSYYGDRIAPVVQAEGYINQSNSNLATGYFAENISTGNAAYAGFVAKGSGSDYFNNVTSLQHFGDNYFQTYLQNSGIVYSTNNLFFIGTKNISFIDFRLGNQVNNNISEANTDSIFRMNADRTTAFPSLTTTLIDGEPTGRSAVTREWVEQFYTQQKEVTGIYTVIDSDHKKTIFLEDTINRNITVNTVTISGFTTEFINVGTSTYTFIAGTGTLNNPDGTKLLPNRICTLFKRNSDSEFWLKGELE